MAQNATTLTSFLAAYNSSKTLPFILLDLRPAPLFSLAHIEHATNFPFDSPEDALHSRQHELPPPAIATPIAIVCHSPSHFSAAARFLTDKSYSAAVHLPPHVASRLPHAAGPHSRRLWFSAPVLSDLLSSHRLSVPSDTALDIAAGSGRNAYYMASYGLKVLAIDRDSTLLSLATHLSRRHYDMPRVRKGGCVNTVQRTLGANLKEDAAFFKLHAAGLVLIARFLRRGLLELLPLAVAPGGYIVYEHFLRGCERFGRPNKPSQMLNMGELANIFCEKAGFEILRDEQCKLSDGRPVVRFVATRIKSQ